MAMNLQSWGEGRLFSEAESGATEDAYLEARWLVEIIGGGKGFISGRGRHGMNILYARTGLGDRRTLAVE